MSWDSISKSPRKKPTSTSRIGSSNNQRIPVVPSLKVLPSRSRSRKNLKRKNQKSLSLLPHLRMKAIQTRHLLPPMTTMRTKRTMKLATVTDGFLVRVASIMTGPSEMTNLGIGVGIAVATNIVTCRVDGSRSEHLAHHRDDFGAVELDRVHHEFVR